MSDLRERIQLAAMSVASAGATRILVYSEVADGRASADVFSQLPGKPTVGYSFATPELRDLVQAYWEAGEGEVAARGWAAMSFIVDGAHITTEFVEPALLDAQETLEQRRPRAAALCFPGTPVDYSQPYAWR